MHLRNPRPVALVRRYGVPLAGAVALLAGGTLPVAADTDPVPIAEIQGDGDASPLAGSTVTTEGVVTAVYPSGGFNGFYLQTPGPDITPGRSDGIFVYGTTAVAVGECYSVSGRVTEYFGLTELTNVTVAATQDCAAAQVVELDAVPQTDAQKEQYEGMIVRPVGEYTITNNYQLNQYGQLGLVAGSEPLFQATEVVEPGSAAEAYEAQNKARYITLDDGSSWDYLRNKAARSSPLPYLSEQQPMRTGSQVVFTSPVILDYRYQWNLQPVGQVVGADDPDIPVSGENDRAATVPDVGGDIQLAAFNVLNYFTDLGVTEDQYKDCDYYADRNGDPVATDYCEVRGAWSEAAFADQQAKLVSGINGTGAEVVALMEIENSAGISYLPGKNRDESLAALVEALNDAGGNWAYAPSPLVTGTNEDVIRTAFIYDPAEVQTLGPSQILLEESFANARYPLAQKFKALKAGEPFVAVANHFKSKGSGADDGTGQGLSNPSREAQAAALTAWVATQYADEAVLLVGDFNAYSKETPVQVIESAGFTRTAALHDPAATTYQYSGRLGSLDHIFANDEALSMVTGSAVWDINADESIAMQYSRRNYNVTDFHTSEPYASSDHDPVLIGIEVDGSGPNG